MALGITVLAIGRKDTAALAVAEDLCRMIRPDAPVDLVHLRASGHGEGSAVSLAAEGAALRRRVPRGARVVALSPEGRAMDSPAFARWLGERREEGRPLAFLIGGAYGLDPQLKRACSELLSLSPLTFSHRLALLVLLEQLYRGFAILRGHPYHK